MKKTEIMGLFETQDYLSFEKHEWKVPYEVKDKVKKMVEKYNARATKKGYDNSLLSLDENSTVLSGIFIPKKERKSFFGQLHESGVNSDLAGDIRRILRLCTHQCPICDKQIPVLSKTCPICGGEQFRK